MNGPAPQSSVHASTSVVVNAHCPVGIGGDLRDRDAFCVEPAGVRPVAGSVKVLVVRPLPVVMNGPIRFHATVPEKWYVVTRNLQRI
jgi:hypothetical protein